MSPAATIELAISVEESCLETEVWVQSVLIVLGHNISPRHSQVTDLGNICIYASFVNIWICIYVCICISVSTVKQTCIHTDMFDSDSALQGLF